MHLSFKWYVKLCLMHGVIFRWHGTSMGKLAEWSPPPEEANFYQNIVQLVDTLYPEDWREWVVNELEHKDLFGESIPPDLECRLRFALPTVGLARAYLRGSK
ncbi:hypothetical protein O0L34_g19446 [Tuta absoluta]|nr:hypothetical protein O0L34_g19446 [Tuta absoluta]